VSVTEIRAREQTQATSASRTGPSRRTAPTRPCRRRPDRRRAGRVEVAFVPLQQARALVRSTPSTATRSTNAPRWST